MATVREIFPRFVTELEQLIRASSRPELASQVGDLPVVSRCRCGQPNCAHFYTAPPPQGAYSAGHASIPLGAEQGLIVLDIINDRIVAVEVVDRDDVKASLDAHIPC